MNAKYLPSLLGAGLLLCGAISASADSIVTFQVDMTAQNILGNFDPATQSMQVRGNFGGWDAAPLALTNNPTGANPYLYTGTTNLPLNGSVIAFKYVIMAGSTYEPNSHNRLLTLPSTSGASVVIPPVYFNDVPLNIVSCDVTFQLDLAQQINTGAFISGVSTSYVRGTFNDFGTTVPLTNDPTILRTNANGLVTSNVYVGTVTISGNPPQSGGSPGQTYDYKFYIDTGSNWEAPTPGTGDPNDNNNRFFNLSSSPTQKLPVIFFNDAPYAPVGTNNVTFQVDMSAQLLAGNFFPSGTVEVRGDFNSWGSDTNTTIHCTNDTAASNPNLYSAEVRIIDGVGARHQYKFWATNDVHTLNGGWETMADNRTMQIIAGPPNPTPNVLPPVFFSDVSVSSLLPADTVVTFSVNMTNAVGTESHTFDPLSDAVVINGVPSFATWNLGLPQVTNNPSGTQLYSRDILLPKGSPVRQT